MSARASLLLKPPFPYFGGKRRVAHLVWPRFGDVVNYVEPFAGSLAVLLGRPEEWPSRCETINDLDCYVANFWRAIQADPEGVAAAADWPVNEADLTARHRWLVEQAEFRDRMLREPRFFDPVIAGWWVWGISQWIGAGWCSGARAAEGGVVVTPEAQGWKREDGVTWKKRTALGKGARGVAAIPGKKLPDISGNNGGYGRGVHQVTRVGLAEWFEALKQRLRPVRVCCGDWSRVLGPSPTVHIGVTAVFLDPPYAHDERDVRCYREDAKGVSEAVGKWARENGGHPKLRIALCGYEGEHDLPGWSTLAWKANGGFGNQGDGRGRENAKREVIWFSPHCLAETKAQTELALAGGGLSESDKESGQP